jgi:HEAT repeat protein
VIELGSQVIERAISGDTKAVRQLIGQLVSYEQEAQSAGLFSVQSSEELMLWGGLLTLLAEGRWAGESVPIIPPNSEDHRRLALNLQYLFLHDMTPAVSTVKEQVLLSGLKSETPAIRAVSAELLGERCTRQASSNLAEALLRDPHDKVQWRAAQALSQIRNPASVDPLIACLSKHDPVLVHQARLALIAIGCPAVPSLVNALSDSSDQVRWEAAKALAQINGPGSATALVNALEDNNAGVRWLAAQGLINLKGEGLEPLLHTLVGHKYSTWLGQGAHHVLQELRKRKEFEPVASPVLEALEGLEPATEVPGVALAALELLEGSASS